MGGGRVASLGDKVQAALEEARILVLGTQVLLGFEFRAYFEPAFEGLPEWAKSLKLLTTCVMLAAFTLIALPASYHRIVEQGEETERFHAVASRLVLSGMVAVGLGLCTDLYVVCRKVLRSDAGAIATSAIALAFMFGAWFGWTLFLRARGRAARLVGETTN
jgi:Na+/glutamate symporter